MHSKIGAVFFGFVFQIIEKQPFLKNAGVVREHAKQKAHQQAVQFAAVSRVLQRDVNVAHFRHRIPAGFQFKPKPPPPRFQNKIKITNFFRQFGERKMRRFALL